MPFSPRSRMLLAALAALALGSLSSSGCNSAYKRSIGAETEKVFSRIFFTDFNTAWQSVLDALKNSRLDISNREGGFIQTKFSDNTAEKNFVDSFGSSDSYLKAQFRFRVSVSRGAAATYNGRPVIKISVRKEQMIQRDVLEGWKPIETDSIEESTLLYRIGRIIEMRGKMNKAEERATEQDVENLGF